MSEARQEHQFKKTISPAEIDEAIKASPFDAFERWELKTIREKCVAEMRHSHPPDTEMDWALTRVERFYNDPWIFEELLSWFAFCARNNDAVIKALEKAIQIAMTGSPLPSTEVTIAKVVLGKLRNKPGLYWELPAIRPYLQKLLFSIYNEFRYPYDEWKWKLTERAIRTIISQKDASFLPDVTKLLVMSKQGKIRPSFLEDELHQGLMMKAVELLEKATKDQRDGWHLLGKCLADMMGQKGEIEGCLTYPKNSFGIPEEIMVVPRPWEKIELGIRLAPDDNYSNEDRAFLLKNCLVQITGDGIEAGGRSDVGFRQHFPSNFFLECGLRPSSKGLKRIWISFLWNQGITKSLKEIVQFARYFSFE